MPISWPRCYATDVAIATILAPFVGVVLMLAPKYQLDTTTQYWVIAIFKWIRYVTLWPWPLTFWHRSHGTWCHFCGQLQYQVETVYDLPFWSKDDYNFPLTANWKSQFLRFFGKWGQIDLQVVLEASAVWSKDESRSPKWHYSLLERAAKIHETFVESLHRQL